MTVIESAIEGLREKSIPDPDVVPAPSQEQILDAESQLGIEFPPSFLQFLHDAGAYKLAFWETYWVGDDSLGTRNIVVANELERQTESPLPDFLVAFHNNGCVDQLCFDKRTWPVDGEYRIVFWDHERTVEANLQSLCVVADNFADWLHEEVRQAEPWND